MYNNMQSQKLSAMEILEHLKNNPLKSVTLNGQKITEDVEDLGGGCLLPMGANGRELQDKLMIIAEEFASRVLLPNQELNIVRALKNCLLRCRIGKHEIVIG